GCPIQGGRGDPLPIRREAHSFHQILAPDDLSFASRGQIFFEQGQGPAALRIARGPSEEERLSIGSRYRRQCVVGRRFFRYNEGGHFTGFRIHTKNAPPPLEIETVNSKGLPIRGHLETRRREPSHLRAYFPDDLTGIDGDGNEPFGNNRKVLAV